MAKIVRTMVSAAVISIAAPSRDLGVSLADAVGASNFDGSWGVTLTCAETRDHMGKSYHWSMTADVRNGFLVAQHGQKGQNGSGTLSGRIGPNGDALLIVEGMAGDSNYNIGGAKPGTRIHYSASVHFDATTGHGKRNEQRDCSLDFIKE